MRILLSLVLSILVFGASRAETAQAIRGLEANGKNTSFDGAGRVLDAYDLVGPSVAEPETAALDLVAEESYLFVGLRSKPELRLIDRRQSLTGSHLRFREVLDGLDVLDSEVSFSFDSQRRLRQIHNRLHGEVNPLLPARLTLAEARELVSTAVGPGDILEASLAARRVGNEIVPVFRVVILETTLEPWEWLIHAQSGSVLRRIPLFFNVAAQVFDPNPVVTLNAPSLQDQNDSASAVPPSGYSTVDLIGLSPSGPLSGPNVRIVELEGPVTIPADASGPLTVQRDTDAFEEVMTYFHLDRSQRYLQSLGFVGARRIISGPIEVDAHAASGADNSFYVSSGGTGRLYFGDGGVDDAEDADILLHEYGHAIQDAIAPNVFFGSLASQARAMGEGFGDYWAFSESYEASIRSGRDPFCVGDWDARCADGPTSSCGYPSGADCLRRVDSTKTMDDYLSTEQRGVEHRNGEIWSSALRRVFISLVQRYGTVQGKMLTDRNILEGTFGLTSSPTFNQAARGMISADRFFNGGANAEAICSSMITGKILGPDECDTSRHGELTLFQSPQQNILIPDANPQGITSARLITSSRLIDRLAVQVNIEHPFRGDLRILLIAPDSTVITLQESNRLPGVNIQQIYGIDATSSGSLDILRGRPAAGEWRLQVIDNVSRDAGRLISWSLLIELSGDDPSPVRPSSSGPRLYLAAVAKAQGASGTNFVTDVRLSNRTTSEASVTAVFTPSGSDGTVRFSAVRVSVPGGHTVALDDVVASLFGVSGVGNVQFAGDVNRLMITSRTYNRVDVSTYGQFIPTASESESVSLSDGVLHIPQLQNTPGFRSNLGFSEIAGGAGAVRVSLFNALGELIEGQDYSIGRHSHAQVTLLSGSSSRNEEVMRAEVRVMGGDARIIAYGSVVDNVSGDPIYLPAQKQAASRIVEVPAVLHADGANDTHWRSDLWLTNVTTTSQGVRVEFFSTTGIRLQSEPQSLAAGRTLVIADVVASLFGLGDAVGHLRLTESTLLVTSRTWTPGPGGTYGQFISGRPVEEGSDVASPPTLSIQLENSARFRTNLGVTEVSGNPATVRIRTFDSSGAQVGENVLAVDANGQVQAGLAQLGVAELFNGRATFEVIGGSGRVLGYASVIDNISGDPIYIPAR